MSDAEIRQPELFPEELCSEEDLGEVGGRGLRAMRLPNAPIPVVEALIRFGAWQASEGRPRQTPAEILVAALMSYEPLQAFLDEYGLKARLLTEEQRRAKLRKLSVSRGRHRQQKYGLTPGQVAAMLRAQGGACKICRVPLDGQRPGAWASIDHDHTRDPAVQRCVRGVLCGTCNSALGMMRDDPGLLEAAAAYLRKWHSRIVGQGPEGLPGSRRKALKMGRLTYGEEENTGRESTARTAAEVPQRAGQAGDGLLSRRYPRRAP